MRLIGSLDIPICLSLNRDGQCLDVRGAVIQERGFEPSTPRSTRCMSSAHLFQYNQEDRTWEKLTSSEQRKGVLKWKLRGLSFKHVLQIINVSSLFNVKREDQIYEHHKKSLNFKFGRIISLKECILLLPYPLYSLY